MKFDLILVAIGGGMGAVGRYGLSQWLPSSMGIAWGTLLVNVTGSFLIGVLFVLAGRVADPKLTLLLGTGLLGGFTTYSTFSLETVRLINAGAFLSAGGYALGTMVLAVMAAGLGIVLAQQVITS